MHVLNWTRAAAEPGYDPYIETVVDEASGVIAHIYETSRKKSRKYTWCIWEGENSDIEVVAGTAATEEAAEQSVRAECDARDLWPLVPHTPGVRWVLADAARKIRAGLDEVEAEAEPTYKILEDLAVILDIVRSNVLSYASDLGPEEVPVLGLFYALGDPPSLELNANDVVTVQREPGNEKDPKAIALHAKCGTRIGYVPAGTAVYLAPQLDAGIPISAWLFGGRDNRWTANLLGPAVLAMRAAKKSEEWQQGDDIPF